MVFKYYKNISYLRPLKKKVIKKKMFLKKVRDREKKLSFLKMSAK